MSRSLRRGAIAATALAFSLGTLTACGAGNNAQTNEIKPDNAATAVGDIKIQNAMIITQPDRESTGPAVIAATIFNNGDTAQTLDSVKVDGTGKTAALSPAKGEKKGKAGGLTIPAGGSVVIGGKDNASAVLPSSRESVKDGNAQPVTFAFSKTGDVKLKSFVVPAEAYFKSWGPSEVPKAPDAKPSGKPSEGASGKPSGKPSGSPSTDPSGTPAGGAEGAEGAEGGEGAQDGAQGAGATPPADGSTTGGGTQH
ncbi:copper chaperone PCu(A)C [Streptomyces lasiicapitis]|uniref:Lipoprotein n=1 Tax=Streptomyces lasiicapitis TaxID=1923961 RepID=A0ABQ2M4H8_9ACTN|nr:copper chaperone PCu(A)C [Streptomyces lasiicapitis]GGO46786.1 lipoprotein [Streptomyces lasiicapitis]